MFIVIFIPISGANLLIFDKKSKYFNKKTAILHNKSPKLQTMGAKKRELSLDAAFLFLFA